MIQEDIQNPDIVDGNTDFEYRISEDDAEAEGLTPPGDYSGVGHRVQGGSITYKEACQIRDKIAKQKWNEYEAYSKRLKIKYRN